ncbi:unnamed protein product, partial [Didymodactylos carnosus]
MGIPRAFCDWIHDLGNIWATGLHLDWAGCLKKPQLKSGRE